jgi:hypothetical protein
VCHVTYLTEPLVRVPKILNVKLESDHTLEKLVIALNSSARTFTRRAEVRDGTPRDAHIEPPVLIFRTHYIYY